MHLLLLSLCLVAQAASGSPGDGAAAAAPAIGSMRAHLLQYKTGRLSDDVLDQKNAGQWNSIAGPNASNATLVLVEVSGAPGGTYTGFFGPKTKYMVRLVARETGRRPKTLLDVTRPIPVLDDRGRALVPFLVYQSGCSPVRLTASIAGAIPGKPLDRSLEFACGE